MYPTVPSTTPGLVPVSVGSCEASSLPVPVAVSFASPKSRILTSPSFVIMTFSGFRSRCTIPASCAFASPSAIWAAIGSSFLIGSAPENRVSRSVLPSTLSIAIHETPSVSPMS